MLKKTIKYVDYNGLEREEDFYFNLSKAEITEMEMSVAGGYGEMLKSIANNKDVPAIARIFKEIILKAYGVKSADGKRFMKSEELTREFVESEAYSELFVELLSSPDLFVSFVTQVIPADMRDKMGKVDTKLLNA